MNNLKHNLEVLDRLSQAFQDSLNHIQDINLMKLRTFRDWEPVDAFFDRFERLIDNLFQATFRSLYIIENLSEPTSLLDLSMFIQRNWIVNDVETLIELKNLRNRLAHEYIWFGISNTQNMIDEILRVSPILFQIIQNVKTYSQKYLKN